MYHFGTLFRAYAMSYLILLSSSLPFLAAFPILQIRSVFSLSFLSCFLAQETPKLKGQIGFLIISLIHSNFRLLSLKKITRHQHPTCSEREGELLLISIA